MVHRTRRHSLSYKRQQPKALFVNQSHHHNIVATQGMKIVAVLPRCVSSPPVARTTKTVLNFQQDETRDAPESATLTRNLLLPYKDNLSKATSTNPRMPVLGQNLKHLDQNGANDAMTMTPKRPRMSDASEMFLSVNEGDSAYSSPRKRHCRRECILDDPVASTLWQEPDNEERWDHHSPPEHPTIPINTQPLPQARQLDRPIAQRPMIVYRQWNRYVY